ncbi:MAG TPA: serine/threonine-protein kinase [Gemmatimonadales bacterium]|nr:serine/threonine-protein kinase [Gemmatimonadales bacterium]
MAELETALAAALAGRYTLGAPLGQGGMAFVFQARDEKHGRPVALKVLRPELALGLTAERFVREIQFAARLVHPNILPLLDSGSLTLPGGREIPYYVMPFMSGHSLRALLLREKQLPVERALRLAIEVAGALEYAHRQGVVHRDIKPENILLVDDRAVVADFGIARALSEAGGSRLTETGLRVGTPLYMSPEQAAGEPVIDGRSDQYSLACVVYEMLAGAPPWVGPTAEAVLALKLTHPPPPLRTVRPSVPPPVEAALAQALAATPADRFPTAEAFGQALGRGVHPSHPAAEPGRGRLGGRGGRGPRWQRWAAAGAVAVLATAAAVWLRDAVPRPAASIAVMPLTPSGPDTSLIRLGRDLALTLSASLDGVGPIRTADPHTILAQVPPGDPARSLAEAAALGRRFGAAKVIHGSLVREGRLVRLDLGLYPDPGGEPLARVSLTADPDSIAAITDSVTHSLLRQIWLRGDAPTPSLDLALRTRSGEALRAFLKGEQAMIAGQWEEAFAASRRAIEADSAFWLAYARYAFASEWILEEPDSLLLARLRAHLQELPERERMHLQGDLANRSSERLAQYRQLCARYPDYWMGWLVYADALTHLGPLVGRTRAEARAAFERAVALHPGLVPAWEHLAMLVLLDRDTAATALVLGRLDQLGARAALRAGGWGDQTLSFRMLGALQRGDEAAARGWLDSVAQDIVRNRRTGSSFYEPVLYGYPGYQILLNRQVLSLDPPDVEARGNLEMLALAFAARGAWDSALTVARRFTGRHAPLERYRLAVLGFLLDGMAREEVGPFQAAARAAALDSEGRSERALLDAMLAAGSGDRAGYAAARAALEAERDSAPAEFAASVRALGLSLAGRVREAGESLVVLERGLADTAYSRPLGYARGFLLGVHRTLAARWLLQAGDTQNASGLLRWTETPFFPQFSTNWSLPALAPAYLLRARLEAAAGLADRSAESYRAFLRYYDLPPASYRAAREEALEQVRGGAGHR